MARVYQLTESEALLAFEQVASHCEALKNWIASQVEQGNIVKATHLVQELRKFQALYAKLNVNVHHELDAKEGG